MKKIEVRVTFTEEVLGTSSNDVAVFDKFVDVIAHILAGIKEAR